MEPNICYLYEHWSSCNRQIPPHDWPLQAPLVHRVQYQQAKCKQALNAYQLQQSLLKQDFNIALKILNELWEGFIEDQISLCNQKRDRKKILAAKKQYLVLMNSQLKKKRQKMQINLAKLKVRRGP